MGRIVYLGFSTSQVAGGQKMIFRHVEALRSLGFDAVFWTNHQGVLPSWFRHDVPVEQGSEFQDDDILVVPGDAANALQFFAETGKRIFVFCQNQYTFATEGYEAIRSRYSDRMPTFISVGRICAASICRAFPQASVEIIPCFADERLFRPGEYRRAIFACSPRKRPNEAQIISALFRQFHPRHHGWRWLPFNESTEGEVAEGLSTAGVFLSLARLESVGMTALEAMACGCVVAGFTGVGGREYANASNGFWVEEDDLEGAADALARAADLVLTGGAPLHAYREAAAHTAQAWSFTTFRSALENVWMRQAPEMRTLRSGTE